MYQSSISNLKPKSGLMSRPPWKSPGLADTMFAGCHRAFKKVFSVHRAPELIVYGLFQGLGGSFIVGRIHESLPGFTRNGSHKLLAPLAMLSRFARARESNIAISLPDPNGKAKTAWSDANGYFSFWTEEAEDFSSMVDRGFIADYPTLFHAQDRYIVSEETPFIVISDVDDTIIESGATSMFHSLKSAFVTSLESRSAVSGMVDCYQWLRGQRSKACEQTAPVFCYVTSSSWSLFGYLSELLNLKGFPRGLFLMQALGIFQNKLISRQKHQHKLIKIRNILDFSKTTDVMLIGDSGQHDRSIYRQIAKEYPDRIKGMYIRKMPGWDHGDHHTDPFEYFDNGGELKQLIQASIMCSD
ncbi:MAG: DUF2183 domain-containing protein [Pseudobacteriovorax sp.]|nr:DUF2183 domain-containing protein [Pseudobacteriovorax sp.]